MDGIMNQPKDPSPCRRVQENLSDLLAGDLEASLTARLQAHSSQCEVCRASLATYRQMLAELRRLPLAASGTLVWSRVEGQLRAEELERRRRVRIRTLRAAGVGAAATLLMAVLLWGSGPTWQALVDHLPARFSGWTQGVPASVQTMFLPLLFAAAGGALALATSPLLFVAMQASALAPRHGGRG